MKKIIIDFTSKAKPIEVKSIDLAIASVSVYESVNGLKKFIKICHELSEEEYNKLLASGEAKFHKSFMEIKNKLIVFVPDLNWEGINLLYALYNVADREKVYEEVIGYNESKRIIHALSINKIKDLQQEMINFRKEFANQLNLFNVNKMVREFKKLNIEANIRKDKVLITLKNIKLEAENEGSIFYNEIFLFIKDFRLDGFILRFDNFDYSSYWDLPFILHPYLSVPFLFNSSLNFIPFQDYENFAKGLIEGITTYVGTGLAPLYKIIEDFQELRRLWNGLRIKESDRLVLSKMIFKQKIEDSQNV